MYRRNKRRHAKRPFVFEITYDMEFLELERLDKNRFKILMDAISDQAIPNMDIPYFNCCKGCSNWKGAMTVCNCVLPQMEIDTKYQL